MTFKVCSDNVWSQNETKLSAHKQLNQRFQKKHLSRILLVKTKLRALKKELRKLEAINLAKQRRISRPKATTNKGPVRRCSARLGESKPLPQAYKKQSNTPDRLSKDQSFKPTSMQCVSVLFSDIVGFTKICSNLSAQKVADLLRRLYARFDALAAQHGVTNVDIIGDAYMAATNLHDDQHSDHAARLARFAIDAVRAAQDTPIDADSPDSPSVQIRVGVHCGPVSACVLGAHGGKLTLVGDTVNVASRMESCSIPGHVQCSEAAAALIARQAPDVELEPRAGGVHVKGKGQMRTCWVGSATSGPGSRLSGARLRPPRRWSSKPFAGLSLALACVPSVDALRHIGCLRRASLSLSKFNL